MAIKRIRVGVVFGGRSGEHEVSLRSARSVMDAIDRDKYEVLPIGITREGRWIAGSDPMKALTGGEGAVRPAALLGEPGDPSLRAIEPLDDSSRSLTTISEVDVFFPVLHGPYGEDGTIQGLFELADVPYVGAGVLASALCMDKVTFKDVMAHASIPQVAYRRAREGDDLRALFAEHRARVQGDAEQALIPEQHPPGKPVDVAGMFHTTQWA